MIGLGVQLAERGLLAHQVVIEQSFRGRGGEAAGMVQAVCGCGWRGRSVELAAVAADEAGMHRLAIENARSRAEAASAMGARTDAAPLGPTRASTPARRSDPHQLPSSARHAHQGGLAPCPGASSELG